MSRTRRPLLPRPSTHEETFLGHLLRQETIGGAVVLVAAVVAVLWANSPWSQAYDDLRHLELGPLDLEHWAADGALTLFFYVAGLELKRELLVGSLRRPSDAAVPAVAAVCGVLVPATVYLVLNTTLDQGRSGGWAIPAATDIAFALAVLAVVGGALPSSLRAFLLTLAVVDDLVVIVIIAVFYTSSIDLLAVGAALVGLGVFAVLQKIRGESWLWYVPLALGIWWATHESGIHATVAGVAMGLLTRVVPDEGEECSPAEVLEHTLTPFSSGLAVPFFALMSAGVAVHGGGDLVRDPVVLGVFAGLVLGKPAGVLLGTWLTVRLTRAELGDLQWRDLVGVAVLAGVGFTVALLVAELSFTGAEAEAAKTAVLSGSVVSAALAAVILRRRNRVHAGSPG
ncbi:Na+/H+ antiporter NhaA [Nocardioides marmoribigeumensis]|uniref:Na(+)/H(+) antiporter NhaA n=1 Tax=Nocardioides marmoribigeumensis TaxID=433649 RepID=A0ABU2BW00_9ACTN|nr:Na+/H+ antiporter NhaA [Nocardioides marmoribigeumensis]MDR7362814.1 NhaA family Na+:H+ antiporter [Nocardioides marmoribigeumensis]